jgi:phosphoribosylaminoimidazole (AIR) synthetase
MYTPQPAAPCTELARCIARRYDSAGVCIDGVGKRLVIAKATGKVDILAELANARVNDDAACPGDEVLPVLFLLNCASHSRGI